MSDGKCIWPIGGDGSVCAGTVQEVGLFGDMFKVPICEYHLQWHKEIVALHKSGMDPNAIVDLTRKECGEKFAALENKEDLEV